jgi:chaperonin cofactor prefoldin
MASTEKTKLVNEISAKIQSLNLLLSTLEADRSRKSETIEEYRKQYYEILHSKNKNGK